MNRQSNATDPLKTAIFPDSSKIGRSLLFPDNAVRQSATHDARILLIFVICFVCLNLKVFSCFGAVPPQSQAAEISAEDEQMIDQFLDLVLKIDPKDVPLEALPQEPFSAPLVWGVSLYGGYGHENNVLNVSWLKLDSDKYYSAADFFLTWGSKTTQQLNVYLIYENTQYSDFKTESDKQELYSRMQADFNLSDSNKVGISMTYLNQLTFDSDNAVQNEPIPAYYNEEYTDGYAVLGIRIYKIVLPEGGI